MTKSIIFDDNCVGYHRQLLASTCNLSNFPISSLPTEITIHFPTLVVFISSVAAALDTVRAEQIAILSETVMISGPCCLYYFIHLCDSLSRRFFYPSTWYLFSHSFICIFVAMYFYPCIGFIHQFINPSIHINITHPSISSSKYLPIYSSNSLTKLTKHFINSSNHPYPSIHLSSQPSTQTPPILTIHSPDILLSMLVCGCLSIYLNLSNSYISCISPPIQRYSWSPVVVKVYIIYSQSKVNISLLKWITVVFCLFWICFIFHFFT